MSARRSAASGSVAAKKPAAPRGKAAAAAASAAAAAAPVRSVRPSELKSVGALVAAGLDDSLVPLFNRNKMNENGNINPGAFEEFRTSFKKEREEILRKHYQKWGSPVDGDFGGGEGDGQDDEYNDEYNVDDEAFAREGGADDHTMEPSDVGVGHAKAHRGGGLAPDQFSMQLDPNRMPESHEVVARPAAVAAQAVPDLFGHMRQGDNYNTTAEGVVAASSPERSLVRASSSLAPAPQPSVLVNAAAVHNRLAALQDDVAAFANQRTPANREGAFAPSPAVIAAPALVTPLPPAVVVPLTVAALAQQASPHALPAERKRADSPASVDSYDHVSGLYDAATSHLRSMLTRSREEQQEHQHQDSSSQDMSHLGNVATMRPLQKDATGEAPVMVEAQLEPEQPSSTLHEIAEAMLGLEPIPMMMDPLAPASSSDPVASAAASPSGAVDDAVMLAMQAAPTPLAAPSILPSTFSNRSSTMMSTRAAHVVAPMPVPMSTIKSSTKAAPIAVAVAVASAATEAQESPSAEAPVAEDVGASPDEEEEAVVEEPQEESELERQQALLLGILQPQPPPQASPVADEVDSSPRVAASEPADEEPASAVGDVEAIEPAASSPLPPPESAEEGESEQPEPSPEPSPAPSPVPSQPDAQASSPVTNKAIAQAPLKKTAAWTLGEVPDSTLVPVTRRVRVEQQPIVLGTPFAGTPIRVETPVKSIRSPAQVASPVAVNTMARRVTSASSVMPATKDSMGSMGRTANSLMQSAGAMMQGTLHSIAATADAVSRVASVVSAVSDVSRAVGGSSSVAAAAAALAPAIGSLLGSSDEEMRAIGATTRRKVASIASSAEGEEEEESKHDTPPRPIKYGRPPPESPLAPSQRRFAAQTSERLGRDEDGDDSSAERAEIEASLPPPPPPPTAAAASASSSTSAAPKPAPRSSQQQQQPKPQASGPARSATSGLFQTTDPERRAEILKSMLPQDFEHEKNDEDSRMDWYRYLKKLCKRLNRPIPENISSKFSEVADIVKAYKDLMAEELPKELYIKQQARKKQTTAKFADIGLHIGGRLIPGAKDAVEHIDLSASTDAVLDDFREMYEHEFQTLKKGKLDPPSQGDFLWAMGYQVGNDVLKGLKESSKKQDRDAQRAKDERLNAVQATVDQLLRRDTERAEEVRRTNERLAENMQAQQRERTEQAQRHEMELLRVRTESARELEQIRAQQDRERMEFQLRMMQTEHELRLKNERRQQQKHHQRMQNRTTGSQQGKVSRNASHEDGRMSPEADFDDDHAGAYDGDAVSDGDREDEAGELDDEEAGADDDDDDDEDSASYQTASHSSSSLSSTSAHSTPQQERAPLPRASAAPLKQDRYNQHNQYQPTPTPSVEYSNMPSTPAPSIPHQQQPPPQQPLRPLLAPVQPASVPAPAVKASPPLISGSSAAVTPKMASPAITQPKPMAAAAAPAAIATAAAMPVALDAPSSKRRAPRATVRASVSQTAVDNARENLNQQSNFGGRSASASGGIMANFM
jgi:hypothetical protein